MSSSDPTTGYRPSQTAVTITGIDIPFGDLVVLIIKLALASIPAYLLLMVVAMIVMGIFGTLFGGFLAMLGS